MKARNKDKDEQNERKDETNKNADNENTESSVNKDENQMVDDAEDGRNNEIKDEEEPPLKRPRLCCSARLVFSITCFFAVFNVSYTRIGISMAFVCMSVLPERNVENQVSQNHEFNWSSATKGYLISAAFYGFIAGPFVAGFMSFKFGGKLILIIGTLGSGATNFFLPEATKVTPVLFFVIRVVTGFFTSFINPAFYDLVSHWIIPEETQLLVSGALLGIPVSNILNFPISSFFCDWLGWMWLFYNAGIWVCLCGIIFVFTIYNYPESCPFISKEELEFLKKKIPKPISLKIPWKHIVTSLPIYAYIVMHFSLNYFSLSMAFALPPFLDEVHHFPLQANGLLSATPFMGSFIVRILLSLFFEPLRLKLKLSKNSLRKISVSLGASLASLFLLVVTFLSCAYRYWVLGCIVLTLSSLELCVTGGYLLSLLDLCPSYVNIITGIANTVGNSAGLISPMINGLITSHGSREEWNTVFYINISVLVAATVFYLACGQNSLQAWGLATLPKNVPMPRVSIVG